MKKILFIFLLIGVFIMITALRVSTSKHNVILIKTVKVDEVTLSTAKCYLNVAGTDMLQVGFCANEAGNADINSKYRCIVPSPINLNSGRPNQFSATLKGLSLHTKYFLRAYAKTKDGTVTYGNEISFNSLSK